MSPEARAQKIIDEYRYAFRSSGARHAVRTDIAQQVSRAISDERQRIADWVASQCRCIDAYKQIGRIDPECQACDLAAEIREDE